MVELYGPTALTPKEWRIVEMVWQASTNRQIADSLGTNEQVIKKYLREIYDKSGMSNRIELALWYEAKRDTEYESRATRPSIPASG